MKKNIMLLILSVGLSVILISAAVFAITAHNENSKKNPSSSSSTTAICNNDCRKICRAEFTTEAKSCNSNYRSQIRKCDEIMKAQKAECRILGQIFGECIENANEANGLCKKTALNGKQACNTNAKDELSICSLRA